jgi:uncharacterized protein with GYD domain
VEYLHTDKDGNQVKYTDEMIKRVIEDLDYHKDKANKYWLEKTQNTEKVYDFFKERYEIGNEEIVCSVDDVNELLESIGSDKLKSLYTVTGRIDFVVTDVEADSEEDARETVESWLTVEYNGEGNVDDWSIDSLDASQQ